MATPNNGHNDVSKAPQLTEEQRKKVMEQVVPFWFVVCAVCLVAAVIAGPGWYLRYHHHEVIGTTLLVVAFIVGFLVWLTVTHTRALILYAIGTIVTTTSYYVFLSFIGD
jgi:membrane protein YdbS with pleckstrin-like domain